MSHEDRFGAETSFKPKINRHSRRLANGCIPIEERQQHDIARREIHHQQLIARVEAERRQIETFKPCTNRRSHADAGQCAFIPKTSKRTPHVDPNETFRPAINARSQHLASDTTALQQQQQQQQTVRERVQELWRTHAGVGTGEMPIHSVHDALRKLGLHTETTVVDKFLLALGLHASGGVRCVGYDRFAKVFTAVLRAGLPATPMRSSTEAQTVQNDAPTMRRRSASQQPDSASMPNTHPLPRMETRRENTHSPSSRKNSKGENYKSHGKNPSGDEGVDPSSYRVSMHQTTDENSPPPSSPSVSGKSGCERIGSTSLGPSSSTEQPCVDVQVTSARKTTYDPLAECTFSPVINKETRRLRPTIRPKGTGKIQIAYKTREELEMAECTFAPHTARFHANRESLAWWTRAPFSSNSNNNSNDGNVHHTEKESETVMGTTTAPFSMEETQPSNASVSIDPSRREGEPHSLTSSSFAPLAPGFDKAVRRMIQGRRQTRHSFEETLRGSTEDPAGGGPPQPTVVEPFHLRAETRQLRREQQQPLLYVDVDLPSGRTGRIGVHKGDKPEELAAGFSQAYGLSEELRERLESVLREKIHMVLRENVQTLWF